MFACVCLCNGSTGCYCSDSEIKQTVEASGAVAEAGTVGVLPRH